MISEPRTISRFSALRASALALLLVLPLTACADNGPTGPSTGTALDVPSSAQAVAFDVVEEATTLVSGIRDARRLVLTDAEGWEAFWEAMHATVLPQAPAPGIDFSSRMVIAATLGQRGSGGYAVSIPEVAREGDLLYVVVEETVPAPGCVTADVITTPAVAVSVPRRDGDILFVERSRTVPCDAGQ